MSPLLVSSFTLKRSGARRFNSGASGVSRSDVDWGGTSFRALRGEFRRAVKPAGDATSDAMPRTNKTAILFMLITFILLVDPPTLRQSCSLISPYEQN